MRYNGTVPNPLLRVANCNKQRQLGTRSFQCFGRIMMHHLFLAIVSILGCQCDYLYMSCHDNPNIIAYDVNTSSLFSTTLLDISEIDWISSSDLHFRGLAIQDDILYVANSKKSASFIGEWQCNNQLNDSAASGLKFIANFTGVHLFYFPIFIKLNHFL